MVRQDAPYAARERRDDVWKQRPWVPACAGMTAWRFGVCPAAGCRTGIPPDSAGARAFLVEAPAFELRAPAYLLGPRAFLLRAPAYLVGARAFLVGAPTFLLRASTFLLRA